MTSGLEIAGTFWFLVAFDSNVLWALGIVSNHPAHRLEQTTGRNSKFRPVGEREATVTNSSIGVIFSD
jgi:hypothetical protein